MLRTPVPWPPKRGTPALNEHSRKELGAFLRSRRERADPTATGLPAGGRRRTPGLRREEVSLLSGVSLTWYTWVEQGRDINVSPQVLLALARALQLTDVERTHLFRLAGAGPPASGTDRPPQVSESVRDFLRTLEPNPAFVIDRCFDVLAWNRAVPAVLTPAIDLERPRSELNTVWLLFHEPQLRERMPDWERETRWLTGLLRGQAAYETDNPRFAELVGGLRKSSPRFAELWEAHDVEEFSSSVRLYRHPLVGDLELSNIRLAVEGDAGRSIVVHFAAPGSRSAERLLSLAQRP